MGLLKIKVPSPSPGHKIRNSGSAIIVRYIRDIHDFKKAENLLYNVFVIYLLFTTIGERF